MVNFIGGGTIHQHRVDQAPPHDRPSRTKLQLPQSRNRDAIPQSPTTRDVQRWDLKVSPTNRSEHITDIWLIMISMPGKPEDEHVSTLDCDARCSGDPQYVPGTWPRLVIVPRPAVRVAYRRFALVQYQYIHLLYAEFTQGLSLLYLTESDNDHGARRILDRDNSKDVALQGPEPPTDQPGFITEHLNH
ncbi:hypothetical protein BP00DRAFT_414080 [Aspergillus indologenus CBS 114.80]|uniref:Uncharacterized protein n=1 Tax=Aspergillus indologenus CBS 114.80 TaxID=1450541 RepID=A0A2V5IAL2_9EURO|nr:hypothetical protein BP00DRAFT_414080 [Aspergillus indologenus CBS 114.80]